MVELAVAEDQEPVEAFTADGADPALDVGVRARALAKLFRVEGSLSRDEIARIERKLALALPPA